MAVRSVNRVFLVGNIQPRDPEYMAGRSDGVKLTLVTKEAYKKNDEEWIEKSVWHNVVCWGFVSKKASKLKKGDLIAVEGTLQNSKFMGKEGVEVTRTYIKATSVTPLLVRKSNQEPSKQKNEEDPMVYDDPFSSEESGWDEA